MHNNIRLVPYCKDKYHSARTSTIQYDSAARKHYHHAFLTITPMTSPWPLTKDPPTCGGDTAMLHGHGVRGMAKV